MRISKTLIKEITEKVIEELEEMRRKKVHNPIETDEWGVTAYSDDEQEANLPELIERRDAIGQQTAEGLWQLRDASTKRFISRETFAERNDAIDTAHEGGYSIVAWYDFEGRRI